MLYRLYFRQSVKLDHLESTFPEKTDKFLVVTFNVFITSLLSGGWEMVWLDSLFFIGKFHNPHPQGLTQRSPPCSPASNWPRRDYHHGHSKWEELNQTDKNRGCCCPRDNPAIPGDLVLGNWSIPLKRSCHSILRQYTTYKVVFWNLKHWSSNGSVTDTHTIPLWCHVYFSSPFFNSLLTCTIVSQAQKNCTSAISSTRINFCVLCQDSLLQNLYVLCGFSVERIVGWTTRSFILFRLRHAYIEEIPGYPRDTYSHSGGAWEWG